METLLIEIDNSKHDFFVNLLKEFSFIKNIKTIENEENEELFMAIQESENDINSKNLTSQSDLKKEVFTWKK
jgi:hypothetical protein